MAAGRPRRRQWQHGGSSGSLTAVAAWWKWRWQLVGGSSAAAEAQRQRGGSSACPIPFRKIETVVVVDDLIELI